MANWAKPVEGDQYDDILSYLDARLNDVATLFSSAPSNQPDGIKRWNNSSGIFEMYSLAGASWSALVLAVAGGGTGSNSASGARTNLGFGSMATQAASAVAITGGTISGITSFGFTGNLSSAGTLQTTNNQADSIKTAGGITAGGGVVAIINTDGKIPAISSTYFANLSGANLTGIAVAWANVSSKPTDLGDFSNYAGFIKIGDVGSAGYIKIGDVATAGYIKIGDVTGLGYCTLAEVAAVGYITSTSGATGDFSADGGGRRVYVENGLVTSIG
jgi:hypothetical protein